MNASDFFCICERHPEQFAKHETLAAFAASLDASKPGEGKVMQWLVERYPDGYWPGYYTTIKNHGFMSKALAMPHARKVTDIFESVMLAQSVNGVYRDQIPYKALGYAFVSALRNPDFAYFGYLGAKYGWSKDWLKRGERLRAILRTNGNNWLTVAKPNAALRAIVGPAGPGDFQTATYEAIKRPDGRILITERDNTGIGTRWIALLDVGESCLSMLSEHELGEIKAEQAQRLAGYGTEWTVTGTDRQKGAIGISEHFAVTVLAHNRDDAWQAAYALRNAKGFGDNFNATNIVESSK